MHKIKIRPISLAARSKASVCGHSLAGNPGANSVGDMDIYFECCYVEVPICIGLITRPG